MKHRPEYDLMVVGNNLKRLRKSKNLSVEYVRKYLRLGSVQAIYKYEEGKGYPQADTLLALMELYDATVDDIVHEHKSIELNDCHRRRLYIFIDSFEINKQKTIKRLNKYYEFIRKGIVG